MDFCLTFHGGSHLSPSVPRIGSRITTSLNMINDLLKMNDKWIRIEERLYLSRKRPMDCIRRQKHNPYLIPCNPVSEGDGIKVGICLWLIMCLFGYVKMFDFFYEIFDKVPLRLFTFFKGNDLWRSEERKASTRCFKHNHCSPMLKIYVLKAI